MNIKRVTEKEFAAWVDALTPKHTLYAPQAKEDRFAFDRLTAGEDLRLDYDVSILPPKKYFLPQKEVLIKFDRKGNFESVIAHEPFVLFGVHPYDFVAMDQLNTIFEQDNYDVHYMARKEAATVVVSDVQVASADVFAGCMGNATVEDRDGYDVLLTRLDDGSYVVETRSEKGEVLTGLLSSAVDADEVTLQQREQVWNRTREQLQKHKLEMTPEQIPALLDKSYDHPLWAEKAELCHSCGSCNLVCPTCYCFTVEDELNWDMETGQRYRQWDGCMLTGFATVTGNHNFRDKKSARYRHRYYRKGKYVWDMIGEIACVGCGRCISACTTNIANPVEVFNQLSEEQQ